MSAGITKTRNVRSEGHIHIHICTPPAAKPLAAARSTERNPGRILRADPTASGERSQSPELVPGIAKGEVKGISRTVRPRTQDVFIRQRRHKRSFQDSGGAGEESA